MPIVEIRCPVGPRRLLFKMIQSGDQPEVVDGNLIELSCSDCKATLRRADPSIRRVLHRYDLVGTLVESEIVR